MANANGDEKVAAGNNNCHNCGRFYATQFKHSFSASLDQTKNQAWQTRDSSWIVTPTSAHTPSLANTMFCTGDCLYSYLFSNELLSTDLRPDVALHFFKRTDCQRQYLASPPPAAPNAGSSVGDRAAAAAAEHAAAAQRAAADAAIDGGDGGGAADAIAQPDLASSSADPDGDAPLPTDQGVPPAIVPDEKLFEPEDPHSHARRWWHGFPRP